MRHKLGTNRLSLSAAMLLAAAIGAAPAQPAGAQPAPPRNPPSVYSDFHPSLSDMMTMAVQPRHAKLGLALRAGNLTYAAYEAGELRGAFRRIAQSMPGYEGKDTAMLLSQMNPPLDALTAAIRAKQPAAANAAYADLTATCNQCHQSLGRDYLVIRAPVTADFPDQDFSRR